MDLCQREVFKTKHHRIVILLCHFHLQIFLEAKQFSYHAVVHCIQSFQKSIFHFLSMKYWLFQFLVYRIIVFLRLRLFFLHSWSLFHTFYSVFCFHCKIRPKHEQRSKRNGKQNGLTSLIHSGNITMLCCQVVLHINMTVP